MIARMDGDDVCAPTRLQGQVRLLEARRDIAAVGTFIQPIAHEGTLGSATSAAGDGQAGAIAPGVQRR
jgi:hypothetical protein